MCPRASAVSSTRCPSKRHFIKLAKRQAVAVEMNRFALAHIQFIVGSGPGFVIPNNLR